MKYEFGTKIVAYFASKGSLTAMLGSEERRKRKRVALHWPVRLFRHPASASVESTTENLTSNGFYCYSREPFEIGERLECIIAIPSGSFGYSGSPISLQCRVRVTRVEDQREAFGLGCYIEDYDLLVAARQARQSTGAPDSIT
jgi:PilZ domain